MNKVTKMTTFYYSLTRRIENLIIESWNEAEKMKKMNGEWIIYSDILLLINQNSYSSLLEKIVKSARKTWFHY